MANPTHHGGYSQADSGYWSTTWDRGSQQVKIDLTLKQSAPWSLFNTRLESESQSASTSSSCSDTIHCTHCGVQFRGRYGRGNMSRHIRNKHIEAKSGPHPCTVTGCSKTFKRQDARLKHERKQHPELHHDPPEQRRQQTLHMQNTNGYPAAIEPNTYTSPPSEIDLLVGSQLLENGSVIATEQEELGEAAPQLQPSMPSKFHGLPQNARIVFSRLYDNLNGDDYSRFCDRFFTRWESIVQELYSTNSKAYAPYAQVLAEIYAVVDELDLTPPNQPHQDKDQACSSDVRHRPDHNQQNGFNGNRNSSLYPSFGSSSSETQAPNGEQPGQRYDKSRPHGKAAVLQGDKPKRLKGRGIDCPIYKHHIMHQTLPPCFGCSRDGMSQVRSHINRNPHGGFPPCLKQCQRCKKEFVDRQLFNNHRVAKSCEHSPQLRGDIDIPWARLYLTIYPNALRVPLPYRDELGWLPDDIIAQCRSMNRPSAPLRSFLDDRHLIPQHHHTQAQSTDRNNVDDDYHSAALNHILSDSLNLPVRNPFRDDHLPGAQTPTSVGHVTEMPYGPEDYLSYLNNASNSYLRSLADAPMHVSPEHLRFVVLQAESIIRNVLQYQARAAQESYAASITNSMPNYHDHSSQFNNSAYFTASNPQPSQLYWEEQHTNWDTSTQPSSYGADSNSTVYFDSTLPSTAPDQFDPMLFSPSFHNYHQPSLASSDMQNTNPYPAAPSNSHAYPSIPENQPNMPSYHDPTLFWTGYGVGDDNSYDLLEDLDGDNECSRT